MRIRTFTFMDPGQKEQLILTPYMGVGLCHRGGPAWRLDTLHGANFGSIQSRCSPGASSTSRLGNQPCIAVWQVPPVFEKWGLPLSTRRSNWSLIGKVAEDEPGGLITHQNPILGFALSLHLQVLATDTPYIVVFIFIFLK